MKKLVLFVMAVIGFAGMSVAQDVWSSGFFTEGTYRNQPSIKTARECTILLFPMASMEIVPM